MARTIIANAVARMITVSMLFFGMAFPACAEAASSRPPLQSANKILFCYQNTELYPNYIGSGSAKPESKPGVAIELLDLIAADAGVSFRYVRYPWNRCLALMAAGRLDSVLASYTQERARLAVFPMQGARPDLTKSLVSSSYFLFHRSGQRQWDGKEFTNPAITVAAPLGYSIVGDLQAKNISVMEAGTTKDLLDLLIYNRVDAVAAPGTAADAIIRDDVTKYSSINKDPIPLRESPNFIVFSHRFATENNETVERVWQSAMKIRDTQRDAILKKY